MITDWPKNKKNTDVMQLQCILFFKIRLGNLRSLMSLLFLWSQTAKGHQISRWHNSVPQGFEPGPATCFIKN